VLSTNSVDLPGYPFGSVTPYALDAEGRPVILISKLALHTKNVEHDPRVSLTMFDTAEPDHQAAGRLTWVGDASPVPDPDTATRRRFTRYLPAAARHAALPDFRFYAITLRRARYIGGFGSIHWLEPEDLWLENRLASFEDSVLQHMNNDHKAFIGRVFEERAGRPPGEVCIVGIDPEGFDLVAETRLVRIAFETPVSTPDEVRAALVAMARREKPGPS
jgi:putative heme iron utilization protein